MRNFIIILTAGMLFTAGRSVAGPITKKFVSAEANWVVHIDHEQFNKSQLGQIFRSEMLKHGMEEKFRNFKEVFSFHPLNDINSITIYGQGKDRQKAVTLIQGRFDKSKLMTFIGMNPGHKQIQYRGIDIQQWSQPKKDAIEKIKEQVMYGGFYGNDTIVLSAELSAIEHAFDVLEGSQPSASDDFFRNMAVQNDNAFFRALVNNVAEIVGGKPVAVVLKQTDQLSLTIGENAKNVFINITLKANSQETAEGIRKMLEGIMGYMTLARKEQPELADLSQKIKILISEDTVRINFESEPDFLQRMIPQQFPWE